MKRYVIIPVDDPDVTHLRVEHENGEACLGDGLSGEPRKVESVPVPLDDQLPRDQRRAVQALIDSSMMYTQLGDRQESGSEAEAVYRDQARDDIMAARRLRAAFGLDDS